MQLPSSPPPGPLAVVIAGVSGAGKTTVGRRVADRLGWAFLDADDLHPAENVARMQAGEGLTSAQRGPWLDAVARAIGQALDAGCSIVVACSALRRAYRDRVGRADPRVRFVALEVPEEKLMERLVGRSGHYAGAALLPSQLEAWEPLGPEEGETVRATGAVEETVASVLAALSGG